MESRTVKYNIKKLKEILSCVDDCNFNPGLFEQNYTWINYELKVMINEIELLNDKPLTNFNCVFSNRKIQSNIKT